MEQTFTELMKMYKSPIKSPLEIEELTLFSEEVLANRKNVNRLTKMAEIRLIVTNDFAQYKQILATVMQRDLEPYIMEAQRLDIKPFLGEELYHDSLKM